MNHRLTIIYHQIFIIALAALTACGHPARHRDTAPEALENADTLPLSYARGFTVRTLPSGIRLVDIADPQSPEEQMPVSYHFALIPKALGEESLISNLSSLNLDKYTPVPVPVERTIPMTMLQLSNFIALNALDAITGITGTRNLFNADIRQRVKDRRIVKIGMEGNFDTELILAADPEVIFISPFKRGGYDAIRETGITLIPHLGYKELNPLGQAEWMKFIALFLGREAEADSLFSAIEHRYKDLCAQCSAMVSPNNIPTVFSGEMHGGNWYAVGGRSTLAQLFRDAGADYVIKDDNTGGVNIEFEQLYSMAANADYWRILNSFPGDFSYDALCASEPRNELFRAFREHKVIYCNMKQTPYYELSPVQPDVLLADLIAVFHPELMPADYQPTFYHLLK